MRSNFVEMMRVLLDDPGYDARPGFNNSPYVLSTQRPLPFEDVEAGNQFRAWTPLIRS